MQTILSADTIFVNDNSTNVSILSQAELFVDKESTKSIVDVHNNPKLFSNISTNILNFGYIFKETVWVKFTIENKSKNEIHRKIVYDNVNTNIVNLYTVNNTDISVIHNGVHNRQEFNGSLYFTFELKLNANEKKEYYLELKSLTHSLYFKLFIQNDDTLMHSEMNNQLAQALFFGGMFVVFIYNFILYLFSKNSIYIYYVGMVFVLALHHLSLRGMISYLLPDNHEIVMMQTAMPVYYTSMAVIGVILFVRKFLNLYRYPKIDFLLKFYIFLVVLIMLFSSKEFYLLNLVAHMTILMSISLEVIGIYLFIIKKEKYAKYFVIVWTITFSGFILTALYHADLVNLPSSHIFELTLITEALLFSIILANQINDLKNEKLNLSVILLEKEKREHQKDKIIQEQTKLASMGQMLGEIAHQWRQPLSEINSIVLDLETDFHQKKLTYDSLNDNLTQIEAVTEYMSQTIEDFNSYYKDSNDKGSITFEQVVKKALNLLESSLKANSIKVSTQILDRTNLDGYSSKLTQALIIIIINAKDALLEQSIDNKKIEIIVTKEGNKHIVTIEDNAGGIKEDNIQKIFEPYFTTKFKSKGVGIGLYMAKKLIEDDGIGQLTVANKSIGARFKILL